MCCCFPACLCTIEEVRVACTCVGVGRVFSGLDACHVVCLVTLKELNGTYSCKI